MSRLQDFIEGQAAHHVAAAKAFKTMSAHLMTVSPEAAEECMKASDSHTQAASDCISCCKTMDAGAGDLEKLMPWPGTTIIPSDVPLVKAVTRVGQPDFQTENVPMQFQHLISDPEFPDEI
jgi:hypothetical protein